MNSMKCIYEVLVLHSTMKEKGNCCQQQHNHHMGDGSVNVNRDMTIECANTHINNIYTKTAKL